MALRMSSEPVSSATRSSVRVSMDSAGSAGRVLVVRSWRHCRIRTGRMGSSRRKETSRRVEWGRIEVQSKDRPLRTTGHPWRGVALRHAWTSATPPVRASCLASDASFCSACSGTRSWPVATWASASWRAVHAPEPTDSVAAWSVSLARRPEPVRRAPLAFVSSSGVEDDRLPAPRPGFRWSWFRLALGRSPCYGSDYGKTRDSVKLRRNWNRTQEPIPYAFLVSSYRLILRRKWQIILQLRKSFDYHLHLATISNHMATISINSSSSNIASAIAIQGQTWFFKCWRIKNQSRPSIYRTNSTCVRSSISDNGISDKKHFWWKHFY